VAAAEFAMVAMALLVFVLAILDIGGAIYERLVLQQAARAGGQYAISFPTQQDGITKAIRSALPSGWTDATSSSTQCMCNEASQGGSCGSVCSAGTGSYIVIQVQRPYSTYLVPTGNCRKIKGNCVTYVVRFQ
jgi:Flp pilus assembly protein TadG